MGSKRVDAIDAMLAAMERSYVREYYGTYQRDIAEEIADALRKQLKAADQVVRAAVLKDSSYAAEYRKARAAVRKAVTP